MLRRIDRVLFVPGALSTAKVWDSVIEQFERLPKIEGKEGLVLQSTEPVHGVQCVVEAAALVKEKHSLTNTVVVGHSYGGYIALELAKRNSEVVGLGLVNSQIKPDHPKTVEIRNKLIDIARKGGVERVVSLQKTLLLYSDSHDRLGPLLEEMAVELGTDAFIDQQHVSMSRGDSTAFLKQTELPVWLCAGSDDALLPALISENIHKLSQNGTLCVLQKTGHMAHIEEPASVATSLHNWLNTI